MKVFILSIVLIISLGYTMICLYLYFRQTSLIFFPDTEMKEAGTALYREDVSFMTEDGVRLNGWYFSNKSDKTILFFHGNAGNISHLEERILATKDLGYNIFLFDYRGYGNSEGKIKNESDIYADGEAAYKYLLGKMGGDSKKILLWGQSLGGAVAIHTAGGKEVGGLVVESSFMSMDAMAHYQYPYIPTTFLLRFHFRSDEALQNVKSKTLFFHSKTDEVVPFRNGEGLFNMSTAPKDFVEIRGSHNGGFMESRDQILSEIRRYF